eukprot:TRINITY_DN101_c0_g1_i3.p1 TRINITY_DN101_c0_g1~~TRINITY_DN101_c0_g1_i3.p1  ORF type:complete len:642 (-),score=301.93 TRINITY_DN101_c0_g1_i3:222-2147(-)
MLRYLAGVRSQGRFMRSVLPTLQKRTFLEWTPVNNREYLKSWTSNETLIDWVLDRMKLLEPSRVHLVDGSEQENKELISSMVQSGTLLPLDPKLRPNSYLARSDKSDVARVEERTFICSESEADAGPTNNWQDPDKTFTDMTKLFSGSMKGRTMYVVPFCMGPLNSPFSQVGVQITDSAYAVANMRIMTRMGKPALDMLGKDGFFVPCVHSVGKPLDRTSEDSVWPCNPEKYIVHFPEQRRIWSFGSGYGGNALLGKKCLALRIASVMARDEGWLAEHMLIVGVTNPEGKKKYFAAAFPSACGKTNLAMMLPKLPGWKIECVGDDIAWMRIGADGRLWAVNPEAGFFGVAPGTSMASNPNAMLTLTKNTIFTNVALTRNNDVWWEGMTEQKPARLMAWTRQDWTPESGFDAAHANARFTAPANQCPIMDADWESPKGVPIEAIIFGGRRSSVVPLIYQARNWEHGTFIGSIMNSETTAAAAGKRGVLRADPFAMRPFCGYNMADYFKHWLSFTERTDAAKLPKIFHVNWFRKSPQGKFLWPGFGDNIRVLKWIFERCDSTDKAPNAVDSPIGYLPAQDSLDLSGLNLSGDAMSELFRVNKTEWSQEVTRYREFQHLFGDRVPPALKQQLADLEKNISHLHY